VSRCSVATAPDYDLSTLPELDVDRAEPTGEYQIVLPDGRPLPQAPRSPAADAACTSASMPAGISSSGRYPEMI
jgi:hypothetical protein